MRVRCTFDFPFFGPSNRFAGPSPVSFWPESKIQCIIYGLQTWPNPWPNRLCLGFSLPTRTIGSTHLSPADILLSWPGFWRFILLSIYLVLFRFIFCLHNLLSPQKHLNYGSWPDMKPPSPARISGEYYGPAAICIRFVNLPGQLQNSYKTLFN